MTYAPEVDPYTETKPNMVSNVLAIAGFIIVTVVVLWGLIHLVTISRSWFASLFQSHAQTAIDVSAPATTTADAPFTLSWNYSQSGAGSYAFLYQCQNGLRMLTPGAQGALNAIPCGAAFIINGTAQSLALTPEISGIPNGEAISVPLSILFMSNATTSSSSAIAQGGATVSVVANATTATTAPTITPATAATHAASATTAAQTGTPDLAVHITSASNSAGIAAVTFTISNDGTAPSGSYYFTAQIPSSPTYTYTSPMQSSLDPSAHVVNTLRFSQNAGQAGVFSVTVDPASLVRESNRTNNTASQTISASTYQTYQYYTPYPYQYQINPTVYSQQNPYSPYYPYSY